MVKKTEHIPLVTTICFAFNHEKFIKAAIRGFMLQKTTFTHEIIIHDDASRDNTQKILRDYEQIHVGHFKNIYQQSNQYSISPLLPFLATVQRARGKYIALCEGDDYWTDPLKLQKQVDFLEKNEDFVCVGGKVRIRDTRNKINKLQYGHQYFEYGESQIVPKEDILDKVRLPFHTSMYLFKRDAIDLNLFDLLFKHSISGDIPILNMLNAKGKIFYIHEELGVQHHNSGGITTTIGHGGLNFLWNRVYMWEQILKLYNQDYLRNLAYVNKKYFKEIFTKKFLNVNLADQISFYRNTKLLHLGLVKVIFVALVQKLFLKLRLKR